MLSSHVKIIDIGNGVHAMVTEPHLKEDHHERI